MGKSGGLTGMGVTSPSRARKSVCVSVWGIKSSIACADGISLDKANPVCLRIVK
jgi:hypothetical protein